MTSIPRIAGSALLLLAAACSPATSAPANPSVPSKPLKLASWNLEFLAATNGEGCNPRDDSDYAAMRRIVDDLDADVIAFQEAENEAAAARVFDPAKYVVIMEARKGAPGGTCGGKFPSQTVIRQAVGFAMVFAFACLLQVLAQGRVVRGDKPRQQLISE